ncbi:MAG: KH domain-containing protein [Desulfobacteraceae bacterium]|nr:MAG: KH domain-containing protein [Desulfobacteraceae bacterium]
MDQLITRIAKSLVDQPENVMVTTVNGSQTMVLELRVAKEDVGKVIGKQGRTAQAMRMLLAAVSSKAKKRTVLEIIE